MIDFKPIREKKMGWKEFSGQFGKKDLADEIDYLSDTVLEMISSCQDADVVFAPHDPEAHDPFAENPEDEDLGWNLGHVIAHFTASDEEAAFIGAELARGVEVDPHRSRFEVDWKILTTIEQVRHRVEESRRMVLASLEMWPDEPHLENHYLSRSGTEITPVMRVLFGLNHADGHLEQIAEIIRQSCAARV